MGSNNSRSGLNLPRAVADTIRDFEMIQPKDAVLIGVSGGPDSVALLHILRELAPRLDCRIGIAHLNHGLRDRDADRDARFVADLARRLNLNFFCATRDARRYGQENKLSLEEAARRVRYTFLYQAAGENHFNKIALGHHLNDNAEIVLMYLLRGSGPLGLSGIPPKRTAAGNRLTIIRPFIRVYRDEIMRYLESGRMDYVYDRSNEDLRYCRNKIRHELLPALQASYNPKIIETLNRLSSITGAEDRWIEDAVTPIFTRVLVSRQGNSVTLSVPLLNDTDPAVTRRIIRRSIALVKGDLRRIRFAHIDDAVRLIASGSGKGSLHLPEKIKIEKKNQNLEILKMEKPHRDTIEPADPDFEYRFEPPGELLIRETGARIKFSAVVKKNLPDFGSTGQQVAFFDMDTLGFPLTVRNRRPGDRFTPLGMTGTQKLKKFFISHKITSDLRRSCPILLSGKKIVWIAGYRMDETVKVTASTKKILKAELLLA